MVVIHNNFTSANCSHCPSLHFFSPKLLIVVYPVMPEVPKFSDSPGRVTGLSLLWYLWKRHGGERIQSTISEGKRTGSDVQRKPDLTFRGALPVKSHKMHFIPLAMSCDVWSVTYWGSSVPRCLLSRLQWQSLPSIPEFHTPRRKAVFNINCIVSTNNLGTVSYRFGNGVSLQNPSFSSLPRAILVSRPVKG